MKKFVLALSLVLLVGFVATPNAHALSCLPTDMYLETVVGDETTQVFVGTATEVKNHTQVVTVTESLQGWVAPKVWVQHPYSNDWQYFCSNGPAKAGEPTIFFTILDQYGSYSVTQTLSVESELGQDFLEMIEEADDVDAGITEATAEERASYVLQSITDLLKALVNLFSELRYWQSEAAR